jgi:hypothetical protein
MKERDLSRKVQRGDRLIHERVHDPYKTRLKLREPTVCTQCSAVYYDGRWQWTERPGGAYEALCQACHRTNDGYPAGFVTLSGTFLSTHKTEVLGVVHNQEKMEKDEHPLHRILAIEREVDSIAIKTTDIHLPRRIGEALQSAYDGELRFHYDEEAYVIRVTWKRDG